jgi:hypothetical protein
MNYLCNVVWSMCVVYQSWIALSITCYIRLCYVMLCYVMLWAIHMQLVNWTVKCNFELNCGLQYVALHPSFLGTTPKASVGKGHRKRKDSSSSLTHTCRSIAVRGNCFHMIKCILISDHYKYFLFLCLHILLLPVLLTLPEFQKEN